MCARAFERETDRERERERERERVHVQVCKSTRASVQVLRCVVARFYLTE